MRRPHGREPAYAYMGWVGLYGQPVWVPVVPLVKGSSTPVRLHRRRIGSKVLSESLRVETPQIVSELVGKMHPEGLQANALHRLGHGRKRVGFVCDHIVADAITVAS